MIILHLHNFFNLGLCRLKCFRFASTPCAVYTLNYFTLLHIICHHLVSFDLLVISYLEQKYKTIFEAHNYFGQDPIINKIIFDDIVKTVGEWNEDTFHCYSAVTFFHFCLAKGQSYINAA